MSPVNAEDPVVRFARIAAALEKADPRAFVQIIKKARQRLRAENEKITTTNK